MRSFVFAASLVAACLLVRGDAGRPNLAIRNTGGGAVQLRWSNSVTGFQLESSTALGSSAQWKPVSAATSVQNGEFIATVNASAQDEFFRLATASTSLPTVAETSPITGETGVAVTRETIVHFSAPLAQNTTLTSSNFYAGTGGRRLLSRIELSSDRSKASLFYLEPMPGNTRITAVFDGTGVSDQNGNPLDADGDGSAGGVQIITFDTVNLIPLAGTAVTGQVFASELMPGSDTGTNALNRPLEGVIVTVDGREQEMRATTDAEGKFTLSPAPPGRFFVKIDGRPAKGSQWPNGDYYPYVGKAWDAVAGQSNNLAGGTGKIYLPLVKAGTLQPVSATAPTTISFPPSVVASNPALNGVSITVPPNSLFNDNGTRGGKVGIAPVPPDRLPGPLPAGLQLPIVITVQTDGALNFDQPAPVCFPNLVDPVLGTPLPAGSKQALLSFNHKKGVWETVGSMTVSADGKFVCTDPGVGILQPGWHGVSPPPHGPKPPCPTCCDGPAPSGGGPRPLGLNAAATSGQVHALKTPAPKPKTPKKPAKPPQRPPPGPPPPAYCPLPPPPPPPPGHCEDLQAENDSCKESCDEDRKGCEAGALDRYGFYVQEALKKGKGKARNKALKDALRDYDADMDQCKKDYDNCVKACDKDAPTCPSTPLRPAGNRAFASALAADPVLDELYDTLISLTEVVRAAPNADDSWSAALEDQIDQSLVHLQTVGGTAYPRILTDWAYSFQEANSLQQALTFYSQNNAPPYPVKYVAEIERPSGVFYLRGDTQPFGYYAIFVPRDGRLVSVRFYDPRTHSYAVIVPEDDLATTPLPFFTLMYLDESFSDQDADGLPDLVELIYGTDREAPDSDGDGILDGAEVEQGTDPLGGLLVQTGVIATTQTTGAAVDVVAGSDLIITAEGTSGVSIFSKYDGNGPILLSHLQLPGDTRRVAIDRSIIVGISADVGVQIISAADRSAPLIAFSLELKGASCAVPQDGIAYVGTTENTVVAINLDSGKVVATAKLPAPVRDLAISGEYLYALTDSQVIVLSHRDGALTLVIAVDSPAAAPPTQRVFAGGELLYAVNRTGFNTFSLTNPAAPVLLKAGTSSQFGWRQLVSNGSGAALAAVGPNSTDDGPHDVSLYDVSAPTNALTVITTFPTPGLARSVALWNGLAYVADNSAGLSVISYLAFDSKRQAPTIEWSAGQSQTIQAVEGTRLTLPVKTSDDVQVRAVEFYLDGVLTDVDGNFPFAWPMLVPTYTGTGDGSVHRLRARAVDTGGNAAWSTELTLTVAPDVTPPEVVAIYPKTIAAGLKVLSATFSKEIDPTSVTPASWRLLGAGLDGVPGTSDDVEISGGVRALKAGNRTATLTFATPLAPGKYRLIVGQGITGLRANHLSADVTRDFEVIDAIYWIMPGGGDWAAGTNWSTGRVPGAGDDAFISFEIAGRVKISGGSHSVRNLYSEGTFELAAGRLQVTGDMQPASLIMSPGAILASAHLRPLNSEAKLRIATGTLDAVTLEGEILLNDCERFSAINGLTVNGKLSISSAGCYTGINFEGPQTLSGTGEIFFAGGNYNYLSQNAPLTIRAGLAIHGNQSLIGQPGIPLTNEGTIIAEVPGAAITIRSGPLLNKGTIEARNGGAMTLTEQWSNAGLLKNDVGILNLAGVFTNGTLGTIQSTGTNNIQGTLINTGQVFTVPAASGAWFLDGGTIRGGAVSTSASSVRLRSGTLDGVTLASDCALQDCERFRSINGLTVNGKLSISSAGCYTGISFEGPQTLGGTGEIILASGNYNYLSPNAPLTIGAGLTLRGSSCAIGQGGVPLTNEGTIIGEVAGTSITVRGSPFLNKGTIESRNGGSVTILDQWSNTGLLKNTQSVLAFGGTFTNATLGSIQNTGTNYIQGVLENSGQVFSTTTASGAWILDGGTIRGGVVSTTGGSLRLRSGTLDGVTLASDYALQDCERLRSLNGLTINGKFSITSAGCYTGISFEGAQKLDGTGEIFFAGGNYNYLSPTAPLTIGAGLSLHGNTCSIGQGNVPLTNEGTIIGEVAGLTITVRGTPFLNKGTIESRNGGSVTILDQWSNTGLLKNTQSILALGGTFTNATLGTVQNTGTNYIVGTLENGNQIFNITAAQGAWTLDGGTIRGGSVITSAGSLRLRSGTLDAVTLATDYAMSDCDRIGSINGLTINGKLSITSAGCYTGISFEGPQTVGGSGEIFFAGGNYNYLSPNAPLTIAAGLTVHGNSCAIGQAGVRLTNEGTIIGEVAGTGIAVRGGPFLNKGTIESRNGGAVTILDQWSNAGLLKNTQSILNLGGAFTNSTLGTVQNTGTNFIQGTLENSGQIFQLPAAFGTWMLDGGTIRRGSINTANGSLRLRSGVLDGVTLTSDFALQDCDRIRSVNGLTVNGKFSIGSSECYTGINFEGPQTLGGSGEIIFLDGSYSYLSPNAAFTIGAGLTIHGKIGTVGERVPVINQGSIIADVAGGVIVVRGTPFTNEGTTNSVNGGTLKINP